MQVCKRVVEGKGMQGLATRAYWGAAATERAILYRGAESTSAERYISIKTEDGDVDALPREGQQAVLDTHAATHVHSPLPLRPCHTHAYTQPLS